MMDRLDLPKGHVDVPNTETGIPISGQMERRFTINRAEKTKRRQRWKCIDYQKDYL